MVMRYRRDAPADDREAIDAETEHVRAHLSACADADDDPDTHADDVRIEVVPHVDGDPGLVSIIGELDAEPDAPYLREDYVPDDTASHLPLTVDRDPTDLGVDGYAEHMTAKEQR